MVDDEDIQVREALAGLQTLYVYLHLDKVPYDQRKINNDGIKRSRSPFTREPIREEVRASIERIETYVTATASYLAAQRGPGVKRCSTSVGEQIPWLVEHLEELKRTLHGPSAIQGLITMYLDIRERMGYRTYVQLMVMPCPGCDMRALVRSADAPVITCEICSMQLSDHAYLEQARSITMIG